MFLYYTLSFTFLYLMGVFTLSFYARDEIKKSLIILLRILILVFSSSIPTFIVLHFILAPFNLSSVYPLFHAIFFALSYFAVSLILKKKEENIDVSYLLAFSLSLFLLNEGENFPSYIMIFFACFASLLILLVYLYLLKNRLILIPSKHFKDKELSIYLLGISFLTLALNALDI